MSKVVCFGEVLFDVFPDGKRIGGAPFNVAAHLKQLDNDSSLISRIGEDSNGSEVLTALLGHRLSPDTVQMDSKFPTGLVQVQVDDDGIPTYEIEEPSSWDKIIARPEDIKLVSEADALVFGSLACRGTKSKNALLKLADHSNLNICDLNIRQKFYNAKLISKLLELTHVLKINTEEGQLLGELFDFPKENIHQAISEKFGISVIIETKGKNGAMAYSGGKTVHALGHPVEVVDTVGSGDAFLAAFIHYFLKNHTLDHCLMKGCKRGAFVASQRGAVPS